MIPGTEQHGRVVERKVVARDDLGEPAELGAAVHHAEGSILHVDA
jgi:hypothetical protein